jgi:hypothetical protein
LEKKKESAEFVALMVTARRAAVEERDRSEDAEVMKLSRSETLRQVRLAFQGVPAKDCCSNKPYDQ